MGFVNSHLFLPLLVALGRLSVRIHRLVFRNGRLLDGHGRHIHLIYILLNQISIFLFLKTKYLKKYLYGRPGHNCGRSPGRHHVGRSHDRSRGHHRNHS